MAVPPHRTPQGKPLGGFVLSKEERPTLCSSGQALGKGGGI